MAWKCIYVERSGLVRRWARGFVFRGAHTCDEKVLIEDGIAIYRLDGVLEVQPKLPPDDPRWPKVCRECAYKFEPEDLETSQDILYRFPDGSLKTIREFPVGTMWDAFWLNDIPQYTGPDGKSLCVRLPGTDRHDWCIDSRASNCTMPNDNIHKCWVRHGIIPNVTVDKNGHTCGAGAGSIMIPGYHGFLRNGELTDPC